MRNAIDRTYSQYGQNRLVIATIFKGARNGTFLEIGAFDGLSLSNTALLERDYGWTGICIEPLPHAFAQLKKNRRCICVNAAAAAVSGDTIIFEAIDGYGAMLSGRADTRHPAHQHRIAEEQKEHNFDRQLIEVETVRAADLLRQHSMSTIDFASIDVEGGELECLDGLLDPDIQVRVLAIENNYGTDDVHGLLTTRGYMRVGRRRRYLPASRRMRN